ncbi:MAG: hypothetical protein DWQ37_01935 [Planctomycetota bacterium]|nr:MAG: hypothetical protein DWQ37_01935 [Planctomycetota bacterium]
MSFPSSQGPSRPIPFQNVSGETIPAYGAMAVTGVVHDGGVAFLACDKPNTTFRREYAVNGVHDVAPGRRGSCCRAGDVRVLCEDAGDAEPGQGWGPKPGQWTLARGFPGYTVLGTAQLDGAHDIVRAACEPLTQALVKTTQEVAAQATTTDYRVYAGTLGSEVDAGFSAVPAARNRAGAALAADEWAWLAWTNDGWELRTAHNRLYPVTLSGNVADGGTLAVTLPDGRGVTATNWSGATLTAGRALAWQSFADGAWYLMGTRSGEAGGGSVWHGTAVDAIAPGASATVALPDASQVEATNWSDDVPIAAGDKVLLWQDAHDANYYCLRAGYLRWYHALINMEGGLLPTDAAATIDNATCLSDGSNPAITSADNLYELHADDNDECLIVESPGYGTGYVLVQVDQRHRPARWFRASMGVTLSAETASAAAATTAALDGGSHPGSITVKNLYGLAAANLSPVLVVEDRSSDPFAPEYILVQVPHAVREVLTSVDWNSPELKKTPRDIVAIDGGSPKTPETVFTATECDP